MMAGEFEQDAAGNAAETGPERPTLKFGNHGEGHGGKENGAGKSQQAQPKMRDALAPDQPPAPA